MLYKVMINDYKINSFRSFVILFFYRTMHEAYISKHLGIRLFLLKVIKEIIFSILHISAQISYKANIGHNIRLLHSGMGVVISAKAIIKDNQIIYHQVTLGIDENLPVDRQGIVIEENCMLGAGAKVISSKVGANSKIGPNAVVYKDLNNNSTYVSANIVIKGEMI